MILPDYEGGSLVNLMATIEAALSSRPPLYVPARALPPAELAGAANVVLLVVDGMGDVLLNDVAPHGALAGRRRARLTSVFPSTTATAISTFLTGLAPRAHAVPGWFTYFREIGCVTAVLPFRVRAGGADLAAAGVEVSDLLGSRPFFAALDAEVHTVSPARIADSAFNSAHCSGTVRHAYTGLHSLFEVLEGILRPTARQRYVYAYFPDVDALAHAHGVGSAEVAACIRALDERFAAFLESAAGTDTAVVVTADHGLIDSTASRRVHIDDLPQLTDSLILPLCGEPRVAYCYVRAGAGARFENAVTESLGERARLHRSVDLVEGGLFGVGPTHPRLLERVGDYVLIMNDDWVVRDTLPGESGFDPVGVHGGLSEAEMRVPLILARC
jgi:hypothetical protein